MSRSLEAWPTRSPSIRCQKTAPTPPRAGCQSVEIFLRNSQLGVRCRKANGSGQGRAHENARPSDLGRGGAPARSARGALASRGTRWTEEQNLNQPGNPEARITEAEVQEAFKSGTKPKAKQRSAPAMVPKAPCVRGEGDVRRLIAHSGQNPIRVDGNGIAATGVLPNTQFGTQALTWFVVGKCAIKTYLAGLWPFFWNRQ